MSSVLNMPSEDDGFLLVNLPGGGSVTLDVAVASEKFSTAITESGDNIEAQRDALRAAMEQMGVPPTMSYKAHFMIAKTCWDMVQEAEKKDCATQQ